MSEKLTDSSKKYDHIGDDDDDVELQLQPFRDPNCKLGENCVSCRPYLLARKEEAGVRKKRTPVEIAVDNWMEATYNLYSPNSHLVPRLEAKLELEFPADEVEVAKQKATERKEFVEKDLMARMFLSLQRPQRQQQSDEEGYDGLITESRIISEKIARPQGKPGTVDKYSCAYCGKSQESKERKLPLCNRCKSVAYCSKDCQRSHWKAAHKKQCIPQSKVPKSNFLTWEQVEAYQGKRVKGKTLEIKVIFFESLIHDQRSGSAWKNCAIDNELDESKKRQVFSCKDRVGTVRRIAAFTSCACLTCRIPGLDVGSTLRWKHPRFHHFLDGTRGARIDEEDLPNISIIN